MIAGAARAKASHHASPLRYPGGKGKLARYLKAVVRKNSLLDRTYIEPFAGGAGVGLSLLLHGYVRDVLLNDLSEPVFAFWKAILDHPEKFKNRIETVSLSPEEWKRQRAVFRAPESNDQFDLGFATFYLNRTNVSGVLNGGMIGGYAQNAVHGLDARFNRGELAARIERVARYRSKIEVTRKDAGDLIEEVGERSDRSGLLVYLDPPYFKKGRDLYYDFYGKEDHSRLRDKVAALPEDVRWVVSYDNEPEIRGLYDSYRSVEYDLSYSVRNGRVGREVMFFSHGLSVPPLSDGALGVAQ